MLSTILGVAHSILEFDYVSLEHLATHLVKCFFGKVRVNSSFKETYSDIINIIAKGILHVSSDFEKKLDLKTIVQSFIQVYKNFTSFTLLNECKKRRITFA